MIPILPILILLRVIFSLTSGRQERPPSIRHQSQPVRRTLVVNWRGFGRPLWFLLAWGSLPGALFLLSDRVQAGQWFLAPAAVVMIALLMPWDFTRLVLIPLHQARLAMWMLRVPSVVWGKDQRGGATLAAARAVLLARRPSDKTVARIEAALRKQKPLRAGGVAAAGLLAAFRGDLDRARRILASVEHFHQAARPAAAVRLAREWLAVDAAERGDWQACARHWGQLQQNELGAWSFQRASRPRSRLTRLIGMVGSRVLRDPRAPGTASVWISWAVAPRRMASLPWVRRALAEARRGAQSASAQPYIADALQHALAAHTLVVGRGAGVKPVELTRALKAWDRAFEDAALMGRIQERALVLEVPAPEGVLFEMRRNVRDDLALASERARTPLRLIPATGVGVEITDRLRGKILENVEKTTEALHRRLEARRPIPAGEELAESLAVHEACAGAAAIGGDELRRIAFSIAQGDVASHAVWLFNVRGEKPVANVIMQWLLSESRAVGDPGAQLHSENVAIGI